MQNLKLFIKALRYKISDIYNSRSPKSNWHKSLLLYPFRMFAHPIETFNDLKYENKASMWIANIMAFLFCFVNHAKKFCFMRKNFVFPIDKLISM